MSTLFDETKPVSDQTVSVDGVVTNPTSAMEQLVGEGKKFKDVEALALGKVESDKFVTDLQAKLNEATSKLGEQDYAKTLLEQLQNASTKTNTVNPVDNTVSAKPEDDTLFKASEEDLKNLVEKTLKDRDAKSTADNNLKIVRDTLQKEYGTEATAKLKAVAAELGLTESYIDTIAAQSPTALFKMIGQSTKEFQPNTSTTVRTEGVNLSSTNQRNSAFYSDMYKTNRKQWSSLEVQNQMVADAAKLGNAFYKP